MAKEKKKPRIETLEDKGTKIDFADFGNGRQAFIFREEKFRGIQIAGFRLGWSEKYRVISPQEITKGTLTAMSTAVGNVSGVVTKPEDFQVHVSDRGIGVDVPHIKKQKPVK
jgi:hypothetical protein